MLQRLCLLVASRKRSKVTPSCTSSPGCTSYATSTPHSSKTSSIGVQRFASSSKPISTSPSGRCGHGCIVCQSKLPVKLGHALSPRCLLACAALIICWRAHSVRFFGLFLQSAGAKLSNIKS